MLYYPFKDSVERIASSMAGVLKYGAPDTDELAPPDVNDFLSLLEGKLNILTGLLQGLPDELPGHPNRNLGPVVDSEDIRQILSVLLPLAEKLDNQCPILSYFPVRLLRDKSSILLEVMNLYCEWKSYLLDQDKPVSQASTSFIEVSLVDIVDLISEGEKSFDLLFKNLQHSANQTKQHIENEFHKTYDQV